MFNSSYRESYLTNLEIGIFCTVQETSRHVFTKLQVQKRFRIWLALWPLLLPYDLFYCSVLNNNSSSHVQSLTAYFYQFVTTRYTTDFYIISTVIYLSFSLFANRLPFRSRQLPLLLFLYQRALIAVERGIEYAIYMIQCLAHTKTAKLAFTRWVLQEIWTKDSQDIVIRKQLILVY